MSKWGTSPVPISTPPVDEFDVIDPALPYALNEALVIVNRELMTDDNEGVDSAVNAANWSVVPIDPRIPKGDGTFQVPDGEVVPTVAAPQIAEVEVDSETATQFHVRTVTPMENGVRFTFTMSDNVKGANCETLTSNNTASMRALVRGTPPEPRFVQADVYRDFDLRYFPSDPLQPESTWRFDSTGDIGIQDAELSLQKRIYRRISTAPGGFRHLGRTYGTDLKLKTLARAGGLQNLANQVADQCRLEPDVVAAGASATLRFASNGDPFVELVVRVQRQARREGRFVFPIPLDIS